MCGLAGWLGGPPVDEAAQNAVLERLSHRGPDGTGAKLFDDAGLLHTRLKIIDLSPLGDQPMPNEDGTVWVVFNGEIYNHRQLRRSLEGSGHRFRGRSDTEVLVHLYEQHGAGMLGLLRGMFALAVFDVTRRALLLGRDRFGIKPLFFTHDRQALRFASELQALRAFPGVEVTPDRQALADYAALLFIPAPRTAYTEIDALEPGSYVEARLGPDGLELETRRYHEWAPEPRAGLSLEDAVSEVGPLLDEGVRRQLESDVPLGAMLSGGIDSSLVCEAAQRELDRDLATFSVRQSDPAHDESHVAAQVASAIGSDHMTLEMDEDRGTWESISGTLLGLGQPFADTSLFAVRRVSRAMRHHVTVGLSGDGGDEAFGGYDLYWQLERIASLLRLPTPAWRIGAALARPAAAVGLGRPSLARRATDLAGADDTSVIETLFCWLRPREHAELLVDPTGVDPTRRHFERSWAAAAAWNGTRVERLSAHAAEVNVRLVLPNDYLFKTDAGSMRESLEVRVPLLDEETVDFGLSLPHRLRTDGRRGKRVLRALAAKRLPAAVAARPKQGFTVPFDRWVDDSFKATAREALLDPGSPVADHFRPEVYRPWVEAFAQGAQVPEITRGGLYQRVMMLVGLDVALRSQGQT
jgi:asparagine synthase (glutamine-hydrolysing)